MIVRKSVEQLKRSVTIMPKKAISSKRINSNHETNQHANKDPIFLDKKGNIVMKILAKPGAKLNRILGISEDGISVQINAPPVDGEANSELIKFMSIVLGIRKSDLALDYGSRSRHKTILISSNEYSVEDVRNKVDTATQDD